MVEHGADLMRLKQSAKLGVAASRANLIDLLPAGEQVQPAILPGFDDARSGAKRRDQRAEIDVAVQ
jgi:hypothetical protein